MNNNIYSTIYEDICGYIQGSTDNLEFKSSVSDVRVDLIVEQKKFLKLWGQVKDCDNISIQGVIVTLLKPEYINNKIEYKVVKTTKSDCMGIYQFEIDELDKGLKYRVVVDDI
ncbi:hypothetical protein [Romboutsia sp.]|uniref:hypothetical protein n=1 Tax=Romboutsia sp. TaxID=1965302 RepID=UPI003F36850D